jgi:hypothetical protein
VGWERDQAGATHWRPVTSRKQLPEARPVASRDEQLVLLLLLPVGAHVASSSSSVMVLCAELLLRVGGQANWGSRKPRLLVSHAGNIPAV